MKVMNVGYDILEEHKDEKASFVHLEEHKKAHKEMKHESGLR